jgi:putative flippase GtrA
MSNINIHSLLRFLLVGGAATALQYLIMAALIHGVAMEAVLASGIGFVLSAVFNYWANARFTFRTGGGHRQSLPRFIVTLGAGCAINVVVLYVLTRLGVSLVLSQLLTTGVVLIWNYTINAVWTFRKKSP